MIDVNAAVVDLTTLTIPSPSQGVWHIGDFPLRGYALCVILGIVVAIWIGEKRWQARGGRIGEVQDVALWAVPFGIVGARLYHVMTDSQGYFGSGGSPIEALYIWQGGLGIWGGVAGGALGAAIGCRLKGFRFTTFVDAVAPAVLVGHAIGRWGNWWNQELFGKPTDLPWGLEIDLAHRPVGYEEFATFHPTFLYECLWNLAAFAVVVWLDRRFRMGHGRAMATYVMAYTLGRVWIEYLRIDPVELNNVLGLRLNVWTSIILFAASAAFFAWSLKAHPGREESPYLAARPGSEDPVDESADDTSVPGVETS